MSEVCSKLHKICDKAKRFSFDFDEKDIPSNGIYIVFEKSELAHDGDRIVRIGTHTGKNQLLNRLNQHFFKEDKNRSIFRKNIGRCLLNKEHNSYLDIWNYDTTSKESKEQHGFEINSDFEKRLEKQITSFIKENFSFVVIKIDNKDVRLELEKRLIATINDCTECKPSNEWLGLSSPVEKIRNSGLWLVQGLKGRCLSEDDLRFIKTNIRR